MKKKRIVTNAFLVASLSFFPGIATGQEMNIPLQSAAPTTPIPLENIRAITNQSANLSLGHQQGINNMYSVEPFSSLGTQSIIPLGRIEKINLDTSSSQEIPAKQSNPSHSSTSVWSDGRGSWKSSQSFDHTSFTCMLQSNSEANTEPCK